MGPLSGAMRKYKIPVKPCLIKNVKFLGIDAMGCVGQMSYSSSARRLSDGAKHAPQPKKRVLWAKKAIFTS
jgi:hypothetical protein